MDTWSCGSDFSKNNLTEVVESFESGMERNSWPFTLVEILKPWNIYYDNKQT